MKILPFLHNLLTVIHNLWISVVIDRG